MHYSLPNPATNATGEYAFKDILDLGAVFSLDLKRVIRSIGFVIGTDIETIIPGVDRYGIIMLLMVILMVQQQMKQTVRYK